MARGSFWKRAGDAFERFGNRLTRGSPSEPPGPSPRYEGIQDPLGTEEYPEGYLREAAIDRIRDWNFENYSERRTRKNMWKADMLDVRMTLASSRSEFQELASINPDMWYH
jgi:hypothetical protein